MASFAEAGGADEVLACLVALKAHLTGAGGQADEIEALGAKLVDFALSGTAKQIRDLEYYLPQLCHVVIHLSSAWESQALERFAFAISQTNMHIALQLYFYLRAAMEDYQPELTGEKPNPAANLTLFYRCARLLQNVERAVVYGNPAGADKLSADALALARKERANAILSANKANSLVPVADSSASLRRGFMLFKRNERKSALSSKPWKERYFRIEQQVLFCLRSDEPDAPVLRALPLVGCTVEVNRSTGAKYPFMFEVINAAHTMRYQLRVEDEKAYNTWITALTAEQGKFKMHEPVPEAEAAAAAAAAPGYTPAGPDSVDSLFDHMSAAQRKRAHFFRQQVSFTDRLTTMADSLRPVEKEQRKAVLKQDLAELPVAPFAYVPMCSSLDRFSYVLRALPNECHAFTTKARVPALMLFEVEEHPRSADVRGFLELELAEYSDADLAFAQAELPDKDASAAKRSTEGGDAEADPDLSKAAAATVNGAGLAGGSRFSSAIALASAQGQSTSSGAPASSSSSGAQIVSQSQTIPELYQTKLARLRLESPFQQACPAWSVRGLIAKSNDDVRQEVFVMQLIEYYQRLFREAGLPLWLHTYTILSTSKSTGLIQLIPDAYSIDSIKKRADFPGSLRAYYEQLYGAPEKDGTEPANLSAALSAFVESMASYSIVCYLLQIKDRHNGNIMIDTAGHIVHIDFGFVFGLAPGKAFSMELRVPWKLNKEMVAVMGGLQSKHYTRYVELCVKALACARQPAAADGAAALMEILTHKSNFPAFRYNPSAIADFRQRLLPRVSADKKGELEKAVRGLLDQSYNNAGSDLYDSFQKATNGIAP